MTKEIEYIPSFEQLFTTEKRFVRLQGSAGSGKSIAVAQRILFDIMYKPNTRVLALRKVARTVGDSIYQTFVDLITDYEIKPLFHITKVPHRVTYKDNGNFVIMTGLDDPEKIKSIKGVNLIWMEEATEFYYDDFRQLNLRLRERNKLNQIILSYNPISKNNWIYQKFDLEQRYKDREFYLKTTYKKNTFLPKDYKRELDELVNEDENYHKIYALGEWGEIVKGRIYKEYKLINDLPDVDWLDKYGIGLDFGWTDVMAIVFVLVKGKDIFIKELLYEQHCKLGKLSELLIEISSKYPHIEVIADSARPELINEISSLGVNIKGAKKGRDSVIEGIQILQGYNFHVTRDSVNVLKELELYKWTEDRAGNILEKPIDKFNHALDGLRYYIFHTHTDKPLPLTRRG